MSFGVEKRNVGVLDTAGMYFGDWGCHPLPLDL